MSAFWEIKCASTVQAKKDNKYFLWFFYMQHFKQWSFDVSEISHMWCEWDHIINVYTKKWNNVSIKTALTFKLYFEF